MRVRPGLWITCNIVSPAFQTNDARSARGVATTACQAAAKRSGSSGLSIR